MVSDETISISGSFISDNDLVAEVIFISAHNPSDRSSGIARITLIDQDTIKWHTTFREGISNVPFEIELKKISEVAPEAKHVLFKNAWSVFDMETKKQFTLKSPMFIVTDALGAPNSKSLFLGGTTSGEVYKYDGLEILAENENNRALISYIHITSDRFVTPGDLKVGDRAEKMTGIYGTIEKNRRIREGNREWYTYVVNTRNGFRTSFAVEDGMITSIRFSVPTGWGR
jgi:hypothetical protein